MIVELNITGCRINDASDHSTSQYDTLVHYKLKSNDEYVTQFSTKLRQIYTVENILTGASQPGLVIQVDNSCSHLAPIIRRKVLKPENCDLQDLEHLLKPSYTTTTLP